MNPKHRLLKIIGAIIGVHVIIGLGVYTNVIKLPITRVIKAEMQYVTDFTDDRKLVGFANNIFVGRVIKQVSRQRFVKKSSGDPESQFEVEVILNIKGNIEGTAVVNQFAGYRNGILYVREGDTVFKPGETYIFSARDSYQQGIYTVASHPGLKTLLLADSASMTSAELRALAEGHERVRQLQLAYPHEILLESDIRNGWIWNNYASVYPDAPAPPAWEDPRLKNRASLPPPPPQPFETSSSGSAETSSGLQPSLVAPPLPTQEHDRYNLQ